MTTIELGVQDRKLGTISLLDEQADFTFTGQVGKLKFLLRDIQRSALYKGLTRPALLAALPLILSNNSNGVWAQYVPESMPVTQSSQQSPHQTC